MFELKSDYKPAWDQQKAIKSLNKYLDLWAKRQTLWWVTGSWKTFTMANIIAKQKKPTLIIAHNKTLAAQLAQEFKEFFPKTAVHYFVSYYDYYQPEAYVSKTDTYIEKEATINEEINRLRHAATESLFTRKDVIIVASVSCIYGIWDISSYLDQVFDIEKDKEYEIEELLKKLVNIQFKRAWSDFKPWTFEVKWDILEIFPASSETIFTIEFWGNEVTAISRRNYLTGEIYEQLNKITIFPAKHTVTTKDKIEKIISNIKKELKERLKYFDKSKQLVKAERLKAKVEFDMEMMQEVWYVNGIENYSLYLDGRKKWDSPYTLIDYFAKWDFLTFIDESHMTIPQIWAMYAWDRSRKENLVENWFRLPSALENRPLQFEEFKKKIKQVIAVSATPWKYEIGESCRKSELFYEFNPFKDWVWKDNQNCRIISKIIRPTGLLDPMIVLKSMEYMVDDIMKDIWEVIKKWERMLITTLTKRSSEELTDYLIENGVKVNYLHSEVDTLERLEVLKDLREWTIDVIVWVNLLREGLDLPEVSKIAILDADKQGFLRSDSALIQIIWRAARNSNWKISMYVEKIRVKDNLKKEEDFEVLKIWDFETKKLYKLDNWKYFTQDWLIVSKAMKKAIDLTYYRREIQHKYNLEKGIHPKTIFSKIKEIGVPRKKRDYANLDNIPLDKQIAKLELEMDFAASNMEYEKAAEIRDEIIELKRWKK